MFDVAALLANQPIPESGRIDIVTNAGGPGILAADACEANGLTVAALTSATTRTRLAVGNIPTYLFPESAVVALAHVTNTRNGGDSRWRPHHISQNSNTIPCVRSKLLLRGYRGPPAADEAAFRNLLLAVSQLLDLSGDRGDGSESGDGASKGCRGGGRADQDWRPAGSSSIAPRLLLNDRREIFRARRGNFARSDSARGPFCFGNYRDTIGTCIALGESTPPFSRG
jgi:hypothetical protein